MVQQDSSGIYEAYLGFNVSGITGTITRAAVRLYVADGSTDRSSIHTRPNNYTGGGPWNELGLTWNNRPYTLNVPTSNLLSASPNTWVEYDVTNVVLVNGRHNFAISSSSPDLLSFYSKEAGTNAPELVIDYQTGIPPAYTDTPTNTPSASPSPTTPHVPNEFQFTATDSTYVRQSFPYSNYGQSPVLYLYETPNDRYNAYVKFAVNGITGAIYQARMRVFVASLESGSFSISQVANTYADSTPWREDNLIWSNQPEIIYDLPGSYYMSGHGEIAFDVTAAIVGNGVYSFRLSGAQKQLFFYDWQGVLQYSLLMPKQTGPRQLRPRR